MKIKNVIYTLMLCCTLPCAAQQNGNTLKECLLRGLDNNYSLRIIRNEEKIAENNTNWANAGMLPTANATVSYSGTLDNSDATSRESGETTGERNITDHTLHAGVDLQWTIFDGFKMQADYKRLKELNLMSKTQTRIAIEDYIAEFTAEYYNFIQQRLRMNNLNYAVKLSKERLRIVQDRYIIGDNSRLDLLQARVDFNADSAESVKQNEKLITSRIRLYELMAERNVDNKFVVADTVIYTDNELSFEELWNETITNNAELIASSHKREIATLDLKSIQSRDYPYMRLNLGYGYTHNRYETNAIKKRSNWGADFGVTIGFRLFDGKRASERRNAKIAIENAELQQENLELTLYADLNNLWQSYLNNRQLLSLERQNVIAARENYDIAYERYLLGDLSGIEMRKAQKSLLDAEDRILVAEYNTKICEISLQLISGNIIKYLE
ncbi:MAG: TolC family protein [Bacteroidaceae bacterium]|nr:TolC family protein [Bacteroidaceae bacterium]